MSNESASDYKILEWDSAFFGFPVATMSSENHDLQSLEQSLHLLRQLGVHLVYFECPEVATTCTSEFIDNSGASLMDTRYTFEVEINSRAEQGGFQPSPPVEELQKTTLTPQLQELGILAGKYSRFKQDKRISDAKFQELYSIWMEKSLSRELAEKVLVTHNTQGSITGVITLSTKGDTGSIGLIAVKPGNQGQGLGNALMQNARKYFESRHCSRATVVTQQRNKPACKLYKRAGYRLGSSMLHYHIWLN